MGRLENIIARNRRPSLGREKVIVRLVFGAIVLLILALMVFTDLGLPPEPSRPGDSPAAPQRPASGPGRATPRVDGVLLRTAPPSRSPAR
ncbi:MAG TPA: hypothetical protein VFK02_18145 [Kofleriaceae bacterium]|nr:hypothetical protein [Kofleriaceae bacterium]